MTENNSFKYSYSAREQEEIKKIRSKYAEPIETELTNLEKLRALDAAVTKKAAAWAIGTGGVGTLLLGTGMSMIMTDIGTLLSLSPLAATALGIAAGTAGIVTAALANPLYNIILKRERKRISDEIIKLSDELIK